MNTWEACINTFKIELTAYNWYKQLDSIKEFQSWTSSSIYLMIKLLKLSAIAGKYWLWTISWPFCCKPNKSSTSLWRKFRLNALKDPIGFSLVQSISLTCYYTCWVNLWIFEFITWITNSNDQSECFGSLLKNARFLISRVVKLLTSDFVGKELLSGPITPLNGLRYGETTPNESERGAQPSRNSHRSARKEEKKCEFVLGNSNETLIKQMI